jgi:CRP/FNR family cyclic AMP-dependent transcriptional regulator
VTGMKQTTSGRRDLVAILEADADLRAAIPPNELEVARKHLVAQVLDVAPGSWDGGIADTDGVGLLVLDGLLARELEVAGAKSLELLGTGDVIRPWDDDPGLSPFLAEATWTILEPTRFALLDARFMAVLGRWPKLGGEIIHRVLRRSRWLAVRLAIGNLKGVAERVTLLLWHMAGNWGRVTAEGTVVPFQLTHELIAELIGARRPSVTTAIGELREAGKLERRQEGWLLMGHSPRSPD